MYGEVNVIPNEEFGEERKIRSFRWRKYSKTFVLVFSWICLGLYSEILGPTLQTLMHQTNSDYEQIGSALAIRSVGLLSGSVLGGWTSDKFLNFRALQMSLALSLAALVNFITPWVRSLSLLSFLLYLAGFSHGFLTTNGNPLLASIWKSEASGPFSLMHAGYGLGGALVSALVAPFTKTNVTANHSQEVFNSIPVHGGNSSKPVLVEASAPFSIVGVTLAICAASFLTFKSSAGRTSCIRITCEQDSSSLCDEQPHQKRSAHRFTSVHQTWQQLIKRVDETRRRMTRSKVFLTLGVFIIYFAIVGNERVFGKFMFTYAIFSPIQMSEGKVYLLYLLYWIVFGSARVITCFLSFVISARLLMFSVVIGTLLSSLGLIVIPANEVWFFIMTCTFSLFKSPLFPTTLAAINRSYEITGFLVLVVNLGSAVGASLMQYAAGSLIQQFGQFVFPYIVFSSACVVLITASLLLILLRRAGDRFEREIEVDLVSDPCVTGLTLDRLPTTT